MTTAAPAMPKFAPTFAMPVIAPPPAGYMPTVAAYYAEIAAQTLATPTAVELLPEQLLNPSGPFQTKGMLITVTNPDSVFQPATPIPPPPLPTLPDVLRPFGTVYAMLGGELGYRRSTDPQGLNSLLPAAFAALVPAVQYPPPADLITPAWGTLRLQVWAADALRLQEKLPGEPQCRIILYVGIDEASLKPLLEPLLKRLYPEQIFLDHIAAQSAKPAAEQKKAPLREVVEAILLTPYPDLPAASLPSYATLIDAYLDAFLAGSTTLMVSGGSAIGEAIKTNAAGDPPTAATGRVELWFVDESGQFSGPGRLVAGAPSYDF
jgi:hypothetical protein